MRKVWLYKKADFNQINNEILEFQWEQFLHKSTDIEDMSNRFTHKYLESNKSTFKSPFMIMFDI
jgi:hypothetical protein